MVSCFCTAILINKSNRYKGCCDLNSIVEEAIWISNYHLREGGGEWES